MSERAVHQQRHGFTDISIKYAPLETKSDEGTPDTRITAKCAGYADSF